MASHERNMSVCARCWFSYNLKALWSQHLLRDQRLSVGGRFSASLLQPCGTVNLLNCSVPLSDMATSTPTTVMGPLGPMTTPFLPPQSCGTIYYDTYHERDMSCNARGRPVRDSSCFLSSSSEFVSDFIVTYSPAIGCPIGWTSNRGVTNAASTQIVVCCPT